MDIHRSRFVPFPASPINAISFSRTTDKNLGELKPALKLAIGRADGSIEIWNPDRAHWVQELVIPGGEGRSIEGLAWTQDPNELDSDEKPILGQLRLFSIGSPQSSAVIEWNLGTGRPLRSSTGNFSEVWCIASQPTWKAFKTDGPVNEPEWKGQDLVAGCGDGTLAIITTADDDLTFKRFLARSGSNKTRCMSVTWQSRDRVVAGFSDSNIRIYDSRNGQLLRAMSLGAGIPGAPKDTLVWRVKCLPSGDIVSADSNGEVKIWDGKTFGMRQRITGHDADCLDLVTSGDGQTVFSAGIDGKIATYKLTAHEGEKRRWAKISHRRIHQGDVKAMAVYDSKQMSVVVTGGADTEPAVIPVREFNRENHRKLPGLPQTQPCVSAPGARLVASWWERKVYIWRIGELDGLNLTPDSSSKQLVLKICISGEDDISDVAMSNDGRLIAISTLASTKLFQLRPSKRQEDRLRASPVTLPSDITKDGSRQVAISPDGLWLSIVGLDNEPKIMRIQSEDDRSDVVKDVAELERDMHKHSTQTGLKSYDQTVNKLIFSNDSKFLCTVDISGHIDVFTLSGELDPSAPASERVQPTRSTKKPSTSSDSDSDSDDDDELPLSFHGQTWTTSPTAPPTLDSPALIAIFHPSLPHLLVLTQHHALHMFDLTTGKLTPWSRRNLGILPPELRTIKDRARGLVWDAAGRAWLHGASWFAMLDVTQDLATPDDAEVGSKRRRRQSEIDLTARLKRRGLGGAGGLMAPGEGAGQPGPAVVRDADGEDVAVVDARPDEGMEVDEEIVPLQREGGDDAVVAPEAKGRKWWCTFKYRPILGVVPLATGGAAAEVMLIERPVWDLEHMRA